MSKYYGEFIRTISDYPIEGINFYDLNSLFASTIWPSAVRDLTRQIDEAGMHNVTHIVGIESRGFVVGAAIAQVMGFPFVMVRKKGAMHQVNY